MTKKIYNLSVVINLAFLLKKSVYEKKESWKLTFSQESKILETWLLTSPIRCPLFVMHELRSEIFDSTSNTHILNAMRIMAVPYGNKQQQILASIVKRLIRSHGISSAYLLEYWKEQALSGVSMKWSGLVHLYLYQCLIWSGHIHKADKFPFTYSGNKCCTASDASGSKSAYLSYTKCQLLFKFKIPPQSQINLQAK